MNTSVLTTLSSVLSLVFYVLTVIGEVKMFQKAGKSGILAIIPLVNFFVLVDIVTGGKWYKGLWTFVPIANIVFLIKYSIKTAKCYGYGTGFGILNLFFPYVCTIIMGFSSNEFALAE